MAKECILYERICIQCNECDMCDLDPQVECTSCGKCLESEEEFRSINIKQFFKRKDES